MILLLLIIKVEDADADVKLRSADAALRRLARRWPLAPWLGELMGWAMTHCDGSRLVVVVVV